MGFSSLSAPAIKKYCRAKQSVLALSSSHMLMGMTILQYGIMVLLEHTSGEMRVGSSVSSAAAETRTLRSLLMEKSGVSSVKLYRKLVFLSRSVTFTFSRPSILLLKLMITCPMGRLSFTNAMDPPSVVGRYSLTFMIVTSSGTELFKFG